MKNFNLRSSFINSEPKAFWVRIDVFSKFGNGKFIESLFWENLPFAIRDKYSWYFKYRAALLQVKYPKYYVDFRWGQQTAKARTKEQILKARLRAKKAKITEINNKIRKAKKNWNQLFSIEQDPLYKKTITKLERIQSEKLDMEDRLKALEKQ